MMRVLRSSSFWIPFAVTLIISSVFFAWELGYLASVFPTLPRPPAMTWEISFTAAMGLLLSANAGLAVWQSKFGSCPMGVKSASSIAGAIGALTLICPACILLPASLIGAGFFFAAIGPYLPLLRIVAIVLLMASLWMLRPVQLQTKK